MNAAIDAVVALLLISAAVGVVVVSILAVVAVPDAVADPTDDLRPGHVDITEVPIAPGAVTGETATLADVRFVE